MIATFGAVDPIALKYKTHAIDPSPSSGLISESDDLVISDLELHERKDSEDYYTAVAISALMKA